jgi:D-arabinose 1-dehydrogenase-like Zn-dependent alcohol dehydrogenase
MSRYCLGAWETLCEKQQNTGYSVNGGFAEYVVADPNYVGRLPAGVSFVDVAPILCAGVTVYKGLKMTDTRHDDWVVVSGIGGLGHMAVQYAKAMGLNVIAVDVDDAKLDLARRLGASLGVNALQEALNFAREGKVQATVATGRLENINNIFARMHAGISRAASSSIFRSRPISRLEHDDAARCRAINGRSVPSLALGRRNVRG